MLKVNVKICYGVLVFLCFFVNIRLVQAGIVWSDDFNDGDFEGWSVGLGEWSVINGTIQGQTPDTERPYCTLSKTSTLAYGTWSFDINLQQGKTLYISFIDSNGTFATFGNYYELQISPRTGSAQFIFYKVEGSYADTKEIFTYHNIVEELHGTWHHIDITRELDGKFSFYLDSELMFEMVDNSIITSEVFVFTSHEYGAFIDNIEVSDEIRIWSDDFNEGDYDGWITEFGSWTAANKTLQALEPGIFDEDLPNTPWVDVKEEINILVHPSTVAYGTWSFDIMLLPNKNLNFNFIVNNGTFHKFGYSYWFYIRCTDVRTSFSFHKNMGVWPDTQEDLYFDTIYEDLSGFWHHIDITRDTNGKFSFYLNNELLFQAVDNATQTSEEFQIISQPYGSYVNNIVVKDVVDPPQIRRWSEDFDDGDYDGWIVGWGNWTAANKHLEALHQTKTKEGWRATLHLISYPSSISVGTWSFDVLLKPTRVLVFYFMANNFTYPDYGNVYLLEILPYTSATEFIFIKILGKHPEDTYYLTRKMFNEDLTNHWLHIDITKDDNGRFYVYLDSEILFDLIDTSINDSEYFDIVSYMNGSLIDNIVVSDTVDIAPLIPIPLDASVEISKEEITTEEDVLVTIQVKDDNGNPVTGVSVNLVVEDKTFEASEESLGMYQALLDTSENLGKIEFVVTAEKNGFVSSESTHYFEVVSPASFEVNDLIINPVSVKEGESVSVSVECINVGGVSGSYDVVLKIDGEAMDTFSVTLDTGESTTVSFIVATSQSGTYSVEVNELTGTYIVEKPSFLDQIPGFPLESIIIGLVIIFIVLSIYQRRN